MGNPPRTRKRVHAIRRGHDGSAFETCDDCGFLVAIALADMHECEAETKRIVKRFKGVIGKHKIVKQNYSDQPRSPFVTFMEEFRRTCKNGKLIEIDRKGFETWRKMSKQERKPYVVKAEEVNSAYVKSLIKEIDVSSEVDDEADSMMVGKFDPSYEDYGHNSSCVYSYDSFKEYQSLNTWKLEMVDP
ncbi:high mobility group B protein 7 [Ricinus communis]|uniref:high mobility group B protein 7 n=1 Tax=Ricinus communis TaxID=3988 RepID=UPI00201AFD3C|nr:high mobility group B protein 7 [Ricinus communis]